MRSLWIYTTLYTPKEAFLCDLMAKAMHYDTLRRASNDRKRYSLDYPRDASAVFGRIWYLERKCDRPIRGMYEALGLLVGRIYLCHVRRRSKV